MLRLFLQLKTKKMISKDVVYWITEHRPENLEEIIFSKNGVCGIGQYIQLREKGFIIPSDKSPRVLFKGSKWFPMPKNETNKEKAARIGAQFHKQINDSMQ